MSGPQQLIVFLIFLGVLVTVHELGHFLAAKWAGVKVLKFSVGFGPRIFGFRRGETEYQVAWVPLGGYVKMHGDYPGEEADLDDPDRARGLFAAPWWKRAIIMGAGSAFNLIFPVFLYFFAFLGDTTYLTPRVGWVAADMPAAIAGIRPGDLVTRVNGRDIVRFAEITDALKGVEQAVPVTVRRGEEEFTFQINPALSIDESNPLEKVNRALLGIVSGSSAAVLGVPAGSAAERAGFKTFDRVLTLNGQPIADEVQLIAATSAATGPLQVLVARLDRIVVGGAVVERPKVLELTVEKQPGVGYQALGAESWDLYVADVVPGSPADLAGLKRGDRFVAINESPVQSSYLFALKMSSHEKRPFKVTWRSGAEERTAVITRVAEKSYDDFKNTRESLLFGTMRFASPLAEGTPAETRTIFVGPKDALVMALKKVPEAIRMIGLVLVKLFTGGVPLEAVGGPIAVFEVATKSAEAGLDVYLMNMAVVSVNLGLVNLLPIPIFDGFSLLAAFWEGIRRRPIPLKVREFANVFGLVVIGMLLVLVFKNDITKLFR